MSMRPLRQNVTVGSGGYGVPSPPPHPSLFPVSTFLTFLYEPDLCGECESNSGCPCLPTLLFQASLAGTCLPMWLLTARASHKDVILNRRKKNPEPGRAASQAYYERYFRYVHSDVDLLTRL